MALADRDAIMVFIAHDNPTAAIDLDLEFEAKAESARPRPKLYKAGRVKKGHARDRREAELRHGLPRHRRCGRRTAGAARGPTVAMTRLNVASSCSATSAPRSALWIGGELEVPARSRRSPRAGLEQASCRNGRGHSSACSTSKCRTARTSTAGATPRWASTSHWTTGPRASRHINTGAWAHPARQGCSACPPTLGGRPLVIRWFEK